MSLGNNRLESYRQHALEDGCISAVNMKDMAILVLEPEWSYHKTETSQTNVGINGVD